MLRRISIAQARRAVQVALGVVWLLAAALQFQPFMFGRGFALEILKPTAAGNPSLVARPVLWSAGIVLAQPQLWNTIFALTQLLLALGLFWRRSVKLALAGTVVWSVIVWWLGEGLGGILTGSATPLMGAPGAVILYALLAMLLWPGGDDEAGRSLAETSIFSRFAPLAWVLLWGSAAYFALLPANASPAALHGMLAGMAGGEPRPIAALDRWAAGFAAHSSALGPVLGALFALCALAVLLPSRLARPLYVLAMVLAAIIWLGQDFGGILTGQATDPNSGPLLFLLALAYWPIGRQPVIAPASADPARLPLLRTGVAVAVACLVGGSSVAAATGLTTQTAAAAPAPTRPTVVVHRTLGPGPIVNIAELGGYRIVFRDTVNRATRPGILSVSLRHQGRPLHEAQVKVTYHSLDMPMPTHTLTLAGGQRDYRHEGPLLGMGGRWQITVSISLPRERQLQLRLTDLISR